MTHYVLSRRHAARVLARSVLGNGRGGIKHIQAPVQYECFSRQLSHSSTLAIGSQEKDLVRPTSHNAASLKNSPNSAKDAGLTTLIGTEVLDKARTVLQSSAIPDPAAVVNALQACERFAKILAQEAQPVGQSLRAENTPASNLLSLEESQDGSKSQDRRDVSNRKEVSMTGNVKSAAAQLISSTAYKVITDPKVYITPELLSIYVNVQSLLGRPRSLPEVFNLYASKPVPKPNTNPIKYTTPNPKKPSAHIPLEIANTALTAAIKTNNIPLCFDVINSSVCAPAFRMSKFFRKAFVPMCAAVLIPFPIYKLASEITAYTGMVDPRTATPLTFAAIMAYIWFTGTIGFVAITTANDQMDRVTWAIGTPLRERWIREEERMLIDRVAGAWGFQQRSRRGEEEGQDWEGLRELIGMRRMVLDKTELMDDME
ncbi:MAG: hypothetical protein Q9225_004688 [Loekoesia sp. 1 TL-2023]